MYPNLTMPLLLMLTVAFGALGYICLRRPVLRWLAFRQVSRRRTEALLVIGPDSRTLVAWGQNETVLLAVDGGPPRPCPGLEPGEWPIRWSSDGLSLFVGRNKGLAVQVSRVELANGRRTLLWELAARDLAGASPPDVRLTPDGKSYAYSFGRLLEDLYLVEGLR